jgi:hypothetical protein
MCVLAQIFFRSAGQRSNEKMTHESKIPNDIDTGVRVMSKGILILREHIVRPDSSSNVAFGSCAG